MGPTRGRREGRRVFSVSDRIVHHGSTAQGRALGGLPRREGSLRGRGEGILLLQLPSIVVTDIGTGVGRSHLEPVLIGLWAGPNPRRGPTRLQESRTQHQDGDRRHSASPLAGPGPRPNNDRMGKRMGPRPLLLCHWPGAPFATDAGEAHQEAWQAGSVAAANWQERD